ncbi:MAG: Type 1 glutamine amidotransferase-like domain-containing protein, partial [Candidatus Methylomirabilales bacterium]
IPAVVVPLRTRAEADRPELTDQVEEASMVFFSGGNPAYLAATLAGTAFWQAVLEAMSRGLAYAGCSAGAACLGEVAPDSSSKELSPELWTPGLGFFPRLRVLPHWDGLDTFIPGAREFVLSSVPPGHRLLTIDERTALLGDGVTWSVVGSGSAGLYSERSRRAFGPGQTFRLRSVPRETIGVLSGSAWEGGERAGRAREGRA